MTLIITALKPEFVVQLSDMRLTDLSTQAVRNEEQRKAIVLSTADARVAVGWCGFAHDRHNGNNTGEWLMDVLSRLVSQQPALKLPDFVNELVARATSHFQPIAEPLDHKACTIVMAGWASPRPNIAVPFAARVSNCEEKWQGLLHTRPTFDQSWLWPSEKGPRPPAVVIVSGAQQATRQEWVNAIGLLLRRDPSPEEVMNACLRVMREAVAHQTYGGLIGRNWVGVEMLFGNPEAVAHYFPEKDSPEQFMPNLVTPQQAFKDVRIWAGPGNPSWWNH